MDDVKEMDGSENVEVMTVIKEKIDRLTDDLEGTDQKITFLQQLIEKAQAELAELRAQHNEIASDEEDLKGKASALNTNV